MNKEFFQVNRNRSKFKKYGRDVKLRYREITQNIDESDFVSFINNPVASIDTLISLLDKVVFYNQTELA